MALISCPPQETSIFLNTVVVAGPTVLLQLLLTELTFLDVEHGHPLSCLFNMFLPAEMLELAMVET
jgi:hypothetical protein